MLVQNYGWPTGPAKIWLWLARRPFGWPRATGPAGSTTPVYTQTCFSEIEKSNRCKLYRNIKEVHDTEYYLRQ